MDDRITLIWLLTPNKKRRSIKGMQGKLTFSGYSDMKLPEIFFPKRMGKD